METKTTNTTTTNAMQTKCASCKKPGRIEGMMKTAEGAFYHQGCPEPKSAGRDAKIAEMKSIKNAPAAPAAAPKVAKKTAKPAATKKVAKKTAATKKPAASKKAKAPRAVNPIIAQTGNPFPGSGKIGPAFDLARKGCTLKALEAFCTKNKIGFARIKWLLRKEEHKGITWTTVVDKAAGTIKLTVKGGVSKSKKAA